MIVVVSLLVGTFLALHGLVHGWYVVLSQGWVEVEGGTGWSGTSWLLSGRLPRETILGVASVCYVAVAAAFVAGGVGVALGSPWAPPVLLAASVLSAAVLVAMWDGTADRLVDQGVVGVAIDLVIVGTILLG